MINVYVKVCTMESPLWSDTRSPTQFLYIPAKYTHLCNREVISEEKGWSRHKSSRQHVQSIERKQKKVSHVIIYAGHEEKRRETNEHLKHPRSKLLYCCLTRRAQIRAFFQAQFYKNTMFKTKTLVSLKICVLL